MWAWGSGLYGQLGNDATLDKEAPAKVSKLSKARAVAGGGQHSLALLDDGTACGIRGQVLCFASCLSQEQKARPDPFLCVTPFFVFAFSRAKGKT